MEPSLNLGLSPGIQRRIAIIGYVLLALTIARFAILGLYPLMDPTEARYAEMGRKMVELNDWITPWFDYHVPFWGKPPLSFWMTAISFKLFGINEFSARLPHFLCGLLIVWMVWRWQSYQSKQLAFVTVVLLATSLLFYASSGLVMTDMWLLLGSTLAMIGFWNAIASEGSDLLQSPWLFFLGISLGLLAKGPIVLVLAGMPILLWMVFKRAYVQVWQSQAWIRGGLMTLLLTLPWYIAAELKTPGFLDYFIAGEHFYRFVVSGWQGDLYGTAHNQVRGTIWLYFLLDALPWSLLFAFLLVHLWKTGKLTRYKFDDQGRDLYLLLFVLVPAMFFSFSGNILWPYVITAFPA
jgi:4-amino-4-deoxy-L-arabinose transferase-like glycosyltransferase